MNRFKFRVWDNKTKSWVHGPSNEVNLFGEIILLGGFMNGISLEDLNHCVIQQFTGLLDKNGKEIYEGDILRSGGLNYEVYWSEYQWSAACPYYHRYHWPRFEYFNRESKGSELVGNIFENRELLAEK